MARREQQLFTQDLNAIKAQAFVKKIFNLQKKLKISNTQMVKDSGLGIGQLNRLKCLWANGKGNHKFLTARLANGLVRFWNLHSETQPLKEVKTKTCRNNLTEDTILVLEILIERVGLPRTRKILTKKGKQELLIKYLEGLSEDKLADLI